MSKTLLRIAVAAIVVIVSAPSAAAPGNESVDQLIAAVQDRLIIEGDMDAAILAAEQLVARYAGQDRAATARALLVLGDLHALKGDGKAPGVYERLRSEYSDQRVRADAAASRLRNIGMLIHGWR